MSAWAIHRHFDSKFMFRTEHHSAQDGALDESVSHTHTRESADRPNCYGDSAMTWNAL